MLISSVRNRFALATICFFLSKMVVAHPMPNTLVGIAVQEDKLVLKIEIPESIFDLILGQPLSQNLDSPILRQRVAEYFGAHVGVSDVEHAQWLSQFLGIDLQESNDPSVGQYGEYVFKMAFFKPNGATTRQFTLHYDAVMHQIVTHKAIVNVENDWENGIRSDDAQTLGVIEADLATAKTLPLNVALEKGSDWKGLRSMVALGIQHIAEGTDHLLFILALLLPAPLLRQGRQWGAFGGTRYALGRLLKITAVFTLGHSLTLLLGALGWVNLPSRGVEIAIALSILISAINIFTPILRGREMLVAGGFGLIHGLAFAVILAHFQLEPARLMLSVLGFNVGIEIMQLVVVAFFVPSLLLLSPLKIYVWVRRVGGGVTLVAALAWLVARVTDAPNLVADGIEQMRVYAPHFALAFFVFALLCRYFWGKKAVDTEG